MKPPTNVRDITLSPESEPRRAKPDAQTERDFARFYHDQPNVDLKALLKQSRRRQIWLYITGALVVLLGVALTWFFVFGFGSGPKFGEGAVKLTIAGSTSAPSGQVVEYTIAYVDDQSVDLKDVELNLRFPAGFTFQSASPAAQTAEGTRYDLGTIKAHQSGSVVVRGQLTGDVGEHKELIALLSYEPANLKARFTKTTSLDLQVVASVLNLTLTGPTQLPADQPLVVSASYRNSSTTKLTGLLLRVTAPAGFELELPKLEALPESSTTWKIPDLEPKAEGKIDLTGRFTAVAAPGQQELRVAVGLMGEDGQFTVQEEKTLMLTLVKSHLTLQLTANDLALKSAADLGQEMSYELAFANEGDVPFTGLTLQAKLDPQWFEWSTLRDNGNGQTDAAKGTLTWSQSTVPLLAQLSPGSRGSIRFQIRLKSALPDGASQNPSFTAQAKADGKSQVGDKVESVTSQSNQVVSKINTKFSLEAEGRYYSDELVKLGSGPLPPRVGQTTTYVMFWRLSNTLNEVNGIEVTTTLPPNVTWTNQTSVTAGQKPTYNPNTREVRWELNRLPAGAGSAYRAPEATFEVAITPEATDLNQVLVLTKTTTATGQDSFSGADLIATSKYITTNLDTDTRAQGKGVVGS
jgi:hypothetical protein